MGGGLLIMMIISSYSLEATQHRKTIISNYLVKNKISPLSLALQIIHLKKAVEKNRQKCIDKKKNELSKPSLGLVKMKKI